MDQSDNGSVQFILRRIRQILLFAVVAFFVFSLFRAEASESCPPPAIFPIGQSYLAAAGENKAAAYFQNDCRRLRRTVATVKNKYKKSLSVHSAGEADVAAVSAARHLFDGIPGGVPKPELLTVQDILAAATPVRAGPALFRQN